jgi:MFS family permease
MVEGVDIARDGVKAAATPAPLIAVASIIVSMALVAIGNGLLFAYIPVRLGAEGFAPTWAGSILTGLSAGGIAGCLLTGWLVRRVGHARAYIVLSALIVLANAALGFGVHPLAWIAARVLYGFAICALFIVAQSWLNDAVENRVRGRVMAVFYVAYVVGLGVGYLLLRFIELRNAEAPLVGIVFTALSMLPVGMTRLRPPPPPAAASIALRAAWRISPVGLAGMLAAGGLSMLVTGFAPIHAIAIGYSQADVATLLLAMPLGTLLLQIPLGWISDRTDRRYVLIAAAVVVMLTGLVAINSDGATLAVMIAIYIVWGGSSDSIYSVANAHANDRAGKDDLVALSSSMIFAWSVAGFVVPGIGTVLTGIYGTQSFMYLVTGIAAAYAGFVIWRVIAARRAEPSASFTPMSAQTPAPVETSAKDG